MPKVSANKVKAFVQKVRSGGYKTPDPEPNYSGKVKVPQSQTITSSKVDEPSPAEEDQKKLDKFGTDWMGYDQAERTLQDMEEGQADREPKSDGGSGEGGSTKADWKETVKKNIAKRKK